MVARWETLNKTPIADLKIFTAHAVQRRHPTHGHIGTFTVLESAEWVNIIPLTRNNEIVMIQQYRHGTDSITLEVPGGLVEEGENPCGAAMRECKEETGYGAPHEALLVGVNEPNPAFMNNRCYSYLWQDCRLEYSPQPDEFEDIAVELVPVSRISEYIRSGKIAHSLTLTALLFYMLRVGILL
ncbi:MAG: NUDIX hydrolase [Bacteroidota bacterium]|nr:NUDIX hydrolase [Candidatus Kapabacteria bacterium]MDW8220216.1 NUDIX hydrolase [Bacteroidota bacterium]